MQDKTKILIIIIGAVLVGGFAMFNSGNLPSISDNVVSGDAVATVNGEEISRQDFEIYKEEAGRELSLQDIEQMSPEEKSNLADVSDVEGMSDAEVREAIVEQTALNRLIERTLLLQAAKEEGFEMDEAEIERQYSQAVEDVGGEEELQKRFEETGISEEKLREDLGEHLMIQQYVQAEIEERQGGVSITDEEARNQYDQMIAGQEGAPPFEAIKEQLKTRISRQKENQFVSELVSELRGKADIEISL